MTSKLAAAIIAAAVLAFPVAARALPCLTPKEHGANAVRQLQTQLMVAALTCARHPAADFAGRYNAFVGKFGANLIDNANVLRGYFARAHGKAQSRQFDAYITSLANEASMRSMGVVGYCEQASPLFEQVLAVDGRELESFALAALPPAGRLSPCAAN